MEFNTRTATVEIQGIGSLLWGQYVDPRKEGETGDDYEERVWRSRFHAKKDGTLFIPARGLKLALEYAAGHLAIGVPGKGQKKFKGVFACSVMVPDDLLLNRTVDDLQPMRMFVPSDGKPGGGKRVFKVFPVVEDWQAEAVIILLDTSITEKVLRTHLQAAGIFSGLGMWRPAKNGQYGRFSVGKMTIEEGAAFA